MSGNSDQASVIACEKSVKKKPDNFHCFNRRKVQEIPGMKGHDERDFSFPQNIPVFHRFSTGSLQDRLNETGQLGRVIS